MFLTFDYTLQVFTDKGTEKCYKYVQIINTKTGTYHKGMFIIKKWKYSMGCKGFRKESYIDLYLEMI